MGSWEGYRETNALLHCQQECEMAQAFEKYFGSSL